jgi:hypothetical protein
MRALTPAQFYACTGTNPASIRAHISKGDFAMAFGADRPLAGGVFLDLDVVAHLLNDELMPAFGRRLAPTLVKVHGDSWMKAVGLADTVAEPTWWFVFEMGPPPTPKPGNVGHREKYLVAVGTFADLAGLDKFAELPVDKRPVRVTGVSVTDVLRRVRENAARIGLDLSAAFFPPDGPLHQEIIEAAKKDRETMLARYHQRMAELAAAAPAPPQQEAKQ